MRHIFIRGILSIVWFAAAIFSGVSGSLEQMFLYIFMGILFCGSAYSSWKKDKDDKGEK